MTSLPNIIIKGESQTVEFKSSFTDEVIVSLVAFANTKGGTVYVGVSDKKEIKGVITGKETITEWLNEIKNKTTPAIIPDVDTIRISDKTVIALFVPEYPVKPVSIKGRYYRRVANSNQLLTASEVANMHLQTKNSSWDYYTMFGKTRQDIDLNKVQKVMDIIQKRNSNFDITSPEEFLVKYELITTGGDVSNGCYLMFCKDSNLFTNIQLGLFASEIVIKDDVTLQGDIISQVEDVMQFIRKHINKELIITDTQTENIQRWQYPLEALRELVLNMIVHRDYRSASDSIVKIFPDYIQFFNPGTLPDSITLEQLENNEYISTPRNRQIARMFKEMGQIEKYGTGIRRVCTKFANYGLPLPEFSLISGGFSVKVYGLASVLNDVPKDVPRKDLKEDLKELSENQLTILEIIKEMPTITQRQLSKKVGINEKNIRNNMTILKDKGILTREGGRKTGYWKISER